MAANFQDIVKLINSAIKDFNKTVPGLQTDMLNSILDELRRLDVDESNNIKTTVNNLKIIGSVKNKLGNLILNDDYISQVKDFVAQYQNIATLQNEYWKTVEAKFTPKPLLREIRIQAVDDTVNSLTENGIGPNIEDEIAQILRTAITSGGSYRELENQLRQTLTDTKKDDGLLTKYTKQITTDAINQYARQYTKAVSDDLGFEWYDYANSLIETSRPFCIGMHERRYFHVSEIPDLLNATDLYYTNPKTGKQELVPIYDKTGLPQGMYATENANNFLILLGGYNCGHQARPVTSGAVPKTVIQTKENKDFIKNVDFTAQEQKQFDDFPRRPLDEVPTDSDKALQERSIAEVVANRTAYVKRYLDKNGNVVNTDNARPLFKDFGYAGYNSAAVHEASSFITKAAYRKLTDTGTNDHVSFYAGGSGSGKTSTIEGIFPGIKENSDAIIDGNLSSYDKAMKQVNELLTNGDKVDIAYVYRSPEDAWNGVIHRMLFNKSEMGRVVPMSTFLSNTEGSYNTIKTMFNNNIDQLPGVRISIIDNSLGQGKAAFMSRDKFDGITFPKDLETKIKAITKSYYDEGEISKDQYDKLNS